MDGTDPSLLPLRFDRWKTVTISWTDTAGATWVVNLDPAQAYDIFQKIPVDRIADVRREKEWTEYFNGRGPYPRNVTKAEVKRFKLGRAVMASVIAEELLGEFLDKRMKRK